MAPFKAITRLDWNYFRPFSVISELIVLYLMKGHLEYFSLANNVNKFGFNTDGSFQYLLSILGQFSAFLSHTTVQGGLYLSLSLGTPPVWSSLLELSMDWARVALSDSYIPSPPPRPPCTHWHSYIPPTPGSPKPKLGHRETIVVGCTTVLRIIIAPPLPTADLYLNLFCAAGGLRRSWGVGRSAPDSRPGLKIA